MKPELSREDFPAITALTAAVTSFLDTGAAPALLPTFLLIARYPDRTCGELARLERMSSATMSRYLLSLGHMRIGLVQSEQEIGDSRYIRHRLTDKGVALAKRMAGAVRKIGAAQ